MKGFSYAALSLSLVMILGSCQSRTAESPEASPVQSLKGYELYSWQRDGDWHFALLVGTNRLKANDEVTSPDVRVQGIEALKMELNRLPNEERVFWSAQRVGGMTMPPDDIISEISTHCAQLGIQLEIDR